MEDQSVVVLRLCFGVAHATPEDGGSIADGGWGVNQALKPMGLVSPACGGIKA